MGRKASPEQIKLPGDFVADAIILELTSAIVYQTIRIRQQCQLKLPDAVIAATALVHGLILFLSFLDFSTPDILLKEYPLALSNTK